MTITGCCKVCRGMYQTTPGCGRPKRYCSTKCRNRAGVERKKAKHQPIVRVEEDLGPDIPLDGIPEEVRVRQREERIASVILEGVPSWAVAERFNIEIREVQRVARVSGIPLNSRWAAVATPVW